MAADPSNPNSVCLLDVGRGGSSLRWDHRLSTRSSIKGGQKLQTYLVKGGYVDRFITVQFLIVCDKVVHDDPDVVCPWGVRHVFDSVNCHVPNFGVSPPGLSQEVLVRFPRGGNPIGVGCLRPFFHISG